MNQSALNLIAVTVFAFTMLSLLGPVIHVSPLVTAIAAGGLLGAATLDTLSWQGRGGALLLDWVAGFSPEHRARVLRHEAGHFLVAHHLDIPITGYTLSAWEALRQGQSGAGGVSFDTTQLDAELLQGKLSAQQIDRYCTVWMAGIAAETLVYGNAEGGGNDRQTLYALWNALRRSPAEAALKERWATLQAKTILEANRAAYDRLVAAMERRDSVEACRAVLDSPLDATSPSAA
ncbi:ATP-dependent Zn protease [Thermoleptolyngbya sp. C42_A2020_037]|uniref:ATP-dependent Zn protease n=1 Tax=Thermoleptolyngbya sp. C42_A2020_037 TaxID=2747799 RepID=UPI0019EC3AFC|nr:ATP-dependent Zn protease [Thermoleptolyngbya sp. C42_A2020_037]MBF2085766.1 ATP-dependent Zn protease [Thermoleptolyngbya sp. C42_A2020_037]